MVDPRIAQAQALHWQIEGLRAHGAHSATLRALNRDVARIYEARARELLTNEDPQGWTDLFAAISHWAEAGEEAASVSLLDWGNRFATRLPEDARHAIRVELDGLRAWLHTLTVVPSLAGYARRLPPLPKAA